MCCDIAWTFIFLYFYTKCTHVELSDYVVDEIREEDCWGMKIFYENMSSKALGLAKRVYYSGFVFDVSDALSYRVKILFDCKWFKTCVCWNF